MPSTGWPARARAVIAPASPVARSQSRSATVDRLPGTMTRSAGKDPGSRNMNTGPRQAAHPTLLAVAHGGTSTPSVLPRSETDIYTTPCTDDGCLVTGTYLFEK